MTPTEMRKYIKQLEAEVAEINPRLDRYEQNNKELMASVNGMSEHLKTVTAATEADAKRYRWLKKQAHVVDEDGGWASHYELPNIDCHNDSPNKVYALKRRTLDQAIDMEMSK